MKSHRIIWTCKATGTEETAFIGSLKDARKAARKMIGETVTFDGDEIGVIENAFVADADGNEI